ncbi:hypothetical protein D9757_013138 [Collybiopsis confluens]|uniref:Phosphatidyl-N-methylethanolamine N-methyltransferase n=1 Tax=Collybiopsis confluens TaxID=2823264 RepID=A0A8H5GSZ2_9AGAR|nr:hypothetical protein D9757_013138 [Collybiopsis confluens]
MDSSSQLIPFDTSKPALWFLLALITFNPTAWNIIARNEYRNHTLTRLFGGNPRLACYFLASMIFSFGMLRDCLYRYALLQQPYGLLLPQPWNTLVGFALIVSGQVLAMSAYYQLGVTGTSMGDYFGLLKDSRVEGFPFSVLRDPMYVGSTISFVGGAFWGERPVGLFVSTWIWIVYYVALRFEGPFTDMIYLRRGEVKTQGIVDLTGSERGTAIDNDGLAPEAKRKEI